MARSAKISVSIGLFVFVLGFLGHIVFAPISEGSCPSDTLASGEEVPEGANIHWEPSWWPPGTRCIYSMPDGAVHDFVNSISLSQWVVLALLALLAFGLSQGVAKTYRKIRGEPTR
ncbi:hypothetical protein [Pseudonocardia spinosispora]|uniref:hypothetical protein n=1 Tax=Pseudonocardia spinosispora TaxID=103441 RepID=UPI0012EC845C|nr:hypothetical protein [Pseudonocardia spinosispora]